VAFLRAVNVAGHARIEMLRLRDVFIRAACANAQTYIQSGNVIFETQTQAEWLYGFPNAFVERIAGVPATSRNWSTVTKIASLMRATR
jgi:uncharacterized protein (DUF1697 family)